MRSPSSIKIDLKMLNYICPYCNKQEYAIKDNELQSDYRCSNCGRKILEDLFPKSYYEYQEGGLNGIV